MSLKFKITSCTDPGKMRTANEDAFLADPELNLALIADGMGGHNSGEVASAMAVKVTHDKLASMLSTGLKPGEYNTDYALETNCLRFAMQLANSVIFEAGNSAAQNKGMGTTLSAVMLLENKFLIAHIGDSRIYLFRQGKLKQLTEDHSLVMDHVRKGLLTQEQADKSPLQNILTRALGVQKTPAMDVLEIKAEENDRLMLCTDGLFKAVPEKDIEAALSTDTEVGKICSQLIEAANNNGGPDNITVAICTVTRKTIKESLLDMIRKAYA